LEACSAKSAHAHQHSDIDIASVNQAAQKNDISRYVTMPIQWKRKQGTKSGIEFHSKIQPAPDY